MNDKSKDVLYEVKTYTDASNITIRPVMSVADIAGGSVWFTPILLEASPILITNSGISFFEAFTLNSFRTDFFSGGANLFGQLANNNFNYDDKIDYADPLISGISGGWGSLVLESSISFTIGNDGVQLEFEGVQNNKFTNQFPRKEA